MALPSQYSDVKALIKKEGTSPQNAKLKNILRVKLYLESETIFFLTGFYWLTGLKKLAARAPPRRYFCEENEKA